MGCFLLAPKFRVYYLTKFRASPYLHTPTPTCMVAGTKSLDSYREEESVPGRRYTRTPGTSPCRQAPLPID